MNEMASEFEEDASFNLNIPLPEGVTSSDVVIDVNIIEKIAKITISKVPENFYYTNALSGNSKRVEKLGYGYGEGDAYIEIQMDGYYECSTSYSQGELHVDFLSPSELHDNIVAIDPGHGGEEIGTMCFDVQEASVNLALALAIQKQLEDSGIGVYLTRNREVENPSREERLLLAEAVSPDVYISIHCEADVDTRTTHGVYVSFAGEGMELARKLADHFKQEESLEVDTTGKLPENPEVASVYFSPGFLTNKYEAVYLSDDNNIEVIATEIVNNIKEYLDGK